VHYVGYYTIAFQNARSLQYKTKNILRTYTSIQCPVMSDAPIPLVCASLMLLLDAIILISVKLEWPKNGSDVHTNFVKFGKLAEKLKGSSQADI
jgi:hypothetical protein